MCLNITTVESMARIWRPYNAFKPPPFPSGFGCCLFQGGGSVVIDSMLIVAPIVCGVLCLSFVFYAVLSILSSFGTILLRKRDSWLFTLIVFLMSCDC